MIDALTVDTCQLSIEGDEDGAIRRTLDAYLANFLAPRGDCKCGERLGGLLGTFEWDIAHGEGRCSACGWPARGYHEIPVDGGTIRMAFPLAYHPSRVEEEAQP